MRRLLFLSVLALGAFGAASAVAAKGASDDLRTARTHLERARAVSKTLAVDAAGEDLRRARGSLREAESRLRGFPLALAARVPVAGRTVRVAQDLTRAGLGVVEASATALEASRAFPVVDGKLSIRFSGGVIPIEPWPALSAGLEEAREALASAVRTAEASPNSWLVPQAGRARAEFLEVARDAHSSVVRMAAAARLMPPLLGRDGRREYLLVVLNGAVARGAGGIVDAVAVVSADRGRVRLERIEPDEFLLGIGKADPLSNVTSTVHFPQAAMRLASLYRQGTKRTADGVIAVDANGLAALLGVVGPVSVDGRTVSAANVVGLLSRDIYAHYPDSRVRVVYLRALSKAVWSRFLGGGWPLARVSSALAPAASEKHFLVWSSRPGEQREAEALAVSGDFPRVERGDLLALVSDNQSGNKLDPYVRRSVRYDVVLSESGDARASARVRVTNSTVIATLPPQVAAGRAGAGVLRERVLLLGPEGTRIEKVFSLAPGREGSADASLDACRATALPGGRLEYRLRLVRQPSIGPDRYEVSVRVPAGFRVASASGGLAESGGVARWSGDLRRDRELVLVLERPWWGKLS